ncbi:MAG: PocR ligand-binding domain-containing protein [Lachnospiraceae bacterium]|nr:PocR ligand-binding domain-containing protein [Lachnospiraceae bacterium]
MISTFDLTKLHSLLKDFYTLTQIRITVFDDTFTELDAYPADIPDFCSLVRTDPGGEKACRECDRRACEIAAGKRGAYTYLCHSGLTESITPIITGNIIIGYLFFGHVFPYSSHEEGWNTISAKCGQYRIDMNSLKTFAFQLPIIQQDHISSASHIMQAVASYLCMERMVALRQDTLPMRIDTYIQEHFCENISAVTIADHFRIGRTKLYELANQSYGMGIAEHIRNLRIEKARVLLKDHPELSIAEIASMCGFSDYNYFITVFKRLTGISPKAYARREADAFAHVGAPEGRLEEERHE